MRTISMLSLAAATVVLLTACAEDGEGGHKRDRDGDEPAETETAWSTTETEVHTDQHTDEGSDDGGDADDDTDASADLVFVNDSEWRSFDSLTLWECSENLAYSYYIDIDDWLDPGETWTLTGVPTDLCFRPELWNGDIDYGVTWDGRHFDPGENRLTIVD